MDELRRRIAIHLAALATLGTEIAVTLALASCTPRSWKDARLLRTALTLAIGLGFVMVLPSFWLSVPLSLITIVTLGGVRRDDVHFVRQVVRPGGRAAHSPEAL